MVIQKHGNSKCIMRLCPVVEHYGNSRKHLHMHPMLATLMYSCFWVPAVGLNLAKKFVINHHAGAAVLMMVQLYKAIIAKFLRPLGQMLRQDVCVNVYFKHAGSYTLYVTC